MKSLSRWGDPKFASVTTTQQNPDRRAQLYQEFPLIPRTGARQSHTDPYLFRFYPLPCGGVFFFHTKGGDSP